MLLVSLQYDTDQSYFCPAVSIRSPPEKKLSNVNFPLNSKKSLPDWWDIKNKFLYLHPDPSDKSLGLKINEESFYQIQQHK